MVLNGRREPESWHAENLFLSSKLFFVLEDKKVFRAHPSMCPESWESEGRSGGHRKQKLRNTFQRPRVMRLYMHHFPLPGAEQDSARGLHREPTCWDVPAYTFNSF